MSAITCTNALEENDAADCWRLADCPVVPKDHRHLTDYWSETKPRRVLRYNLLKILVITFGAKVQPGTGRTLHWDLEAPSGVAHLAP